MRIVVALGGNALIRRGEKPTMALQRANATRAAAALAPLARDHQLIVTHGNGPHIGLLALQAAREPSGFAQPLDVLGAETEGMIGYVLEQALASVLSGPVASVLTQTVVAAGDPAFGHPTKPIGPLYDKAEAQALATARGWSVAEDEGGWRRVVPSPEPVAIVSLPAIRILTDAGVVVICAGGGGIPVTEEPATPGVGRRLVGVEAVVDKDLASALLAQQLNADVLLLLTDVACVYRGWKTAAEQPLGETSVATLRTMRFAPGSMAPKVEAACRFVERGGLFAAIGALEDAPGLLSGTAGTRIVLGAPRHSTPAANPPM
jgi:carbamate kinase